MATALAPVLPRGVYRALYLVKGVPVLVAIDSQGNARKHMKVETPADEPRVKRVLEELLDMIDPQLRLVVEERTSAGWPYDGSAPPAIVRSRVTTKPTRRIYR